ncbi:MAG: PAS domain S-box protein [Candidatus Kariarchaeaceae archaeon]
MSKTSTESETDFAYYANIMRALDNAPTSAILLKDGIIYYVNNKFVELFQYKDSAELLGSEVDMIRPEKLRSKLRRRSSRREQGIPQPTSYKSMGLLQDGSYLPVQVDADRFEIDGEGYTLAYVTDISEDFESSRTIGILESQFHDAVEYSPIATCVTKDRRIIMANLVYIDLFGYDTIDEIYGVDTSIFQAPNDREFIEEKIERREEGEFTVETYESKGLHKDGSEFPIRVTAKRIEIEDGIGILGYIEKL